MAGDAPTVRQRIYIAAFSTALLALAGAVGWLVWLAIATGRVSVRSGIVTRTASPLRFLVEVALGAGSAVVMGGLALLLLSAVVEPRLPKGRSSRRRSS